ncbi:MAG TPA: hypothetical protein VFQ84_04590 [Arenimonas sp.]|uniref:hypothetical protein n=1 Tax=Arenimonas sp. TaxID=1872635 RepID=UPI002D7F2EC6|nr:hypothetical protein [Arenimonas sp.]HEU0152606.1 hypothetical protein [Arenimonas sp.]
MLRPNPGCQVVSSLPAVALPRASDGNGGYLGGWRATLRFEADCLPPVSDSAAWWKPYRITFEQTFVMSPESPGVPSGWRAGAVLPVVDLEQPQRTVDVAAQATVNNCDVLLDRIESEALPCLGTRAPHIGNILREALARDRDPARRRVEVHDDNDLNAKRLSRDGICLHRWRELQRDLRSPEACVVD